MFYILIAYIHLPYFELESELAANPAPRGRPVVISHGDPARGVVRCCGQALESHGVMPGDRVSNVRRRFPDLIVLPERVCFYEAISRKVTALLIKKAPALEWAEPYGWAADLTGCDRLFENNFLGWARQVAADLKAGYGLTARVGLGSNKIMAEFACRLAKPGYAVQLFPEDEEYFLAHASLDLLPGISERQRGFLKEKRLQWARELRMLGEDRLRQWFGNREGNHLWDAIHGRSLEPVKPFSPPRLVKKTFTFSHGAANIQDVVQAGSFLTGNLLHEVHELGGYLRKVSAQLTYTDNHVMRREIHVKEAREDSEYLDAVRRMLENIQMRRVQVRSLSLRCPVDFEPGEQQDLFCEKERIRKMDLETAMAGIRDKYGYRHMYRASGLTRGDGKSSNRRRR